VSDEPKSNIKELNKQLKSFVELDDEIKAFEKKAKELKEKKAKQEDLLLQMFIDSDITNISVLTGEGKIKKPATIFIKSQTFINVTKENKETLIKALEETELRSLVKIEPIVNTASLQAEIRRMIKEGEEIPEKVKSELSIFDKFTMNIRRN